MKTYSVLAPRETHFRPGICEEVDCPNYLHGWKTVIDETTDLGQRQALYIRQESGRRFTAMWDGGLTTFIFEAGQQCFAQHQVPLERDPLFVVRSGDWRDYGPPRIHRRAEDWVEDFASHQQQLADRIERG
jgi:hypothetical protein